MNKILEIKNLSVSFKTENGTIKAVDDISFILNKGETLGIVGESGSGKTVTSLAVMSLISLPPGKIDSGEIIYHNENSCDLLKLPEKKLRKFRGNDIAMIFQEPMSSLNPAYTCGNQVVEMLRLHKNISKKEAKDQTIALFEEVKLPRPESIYKSYPHQLSGGQKQRVMIAMAISCEPAILIADEPTTALDVTVQKTILELMKELQIKYGMGLIFITHDLGVVAQIADKAVVMYKGKIVESNTVENIFKNPQHPYTKGLLACRPPLDKRLKVLPTISDFLNSDNDYFDFIAEKPEERKAHHKKLYSSEAVLEVENIKTYYPLEKSFTGKIKSYVKAVDDVSFEVYPGETIGLVGESGCGKTTLGRTIMRLLKPTEGVIKYQNKDITTLKGSELRAFRKNMQIIFQDPYSSLNPRITVGEAITEPMKVHNLYKNNKERKNKAIELLERVSMNESQYYRYPHEFSGGQRQRICIARALALNPKFIICDESVSALDVSIQAQVLNLLNELKNDFNFTYIFISHDLSVVKFMSDRIFVMKEGKIVESGDADEIYNNPKTDYTRRLIDAIPKGVVS